MEKGHEADVHLPVCIQTEDNESVSKKVKQPFEQKT